MSYSSLEAMLGSTSHPRPWPVRPGVEGQVHEEEAAFTVVGAQRMGMFADRPIFDIRKGAARRQRTFLTLSTVGEDEGEN